MFFVVIATDFISLKKSMNLIALKITGLINIKNGKCKLCKAETTLHKHHLIPRRVLKRFGLLEEGTLKDLVIYICFECEKKIHPENMLIKRVKILSELLYVLLDLVIKMAPEKAISIRQQFYSQKDFIEGKYKNFNNYEENKNATEKML